MLGPSDGAASERALAMIKELTATPELDASYLGRVERITDFGAFVEIMPGCDGLLHVFVPHATAGVVVCDATELDPVPPVALHVAQPVEQHRHPADAAFGERDLDAWEPHRHAREQPVGRRGEAAHREERGEHAHR